MRRNLKRYWRKLRAWWALTKIAGIALLIIGLAGEIDGPVPYLPWPPGLKDFHESLSPEMIGIGVTVLIIDTANERRQQRREKTDLIYRLGSQVHSEAVRSAEELGRRGWLRDGTLNGLYFSNANLKGASLFQAQLQNATLAGAVLEEANLQDASLKNAVLFGANLKSANLSFIDLRSADLRRADLSNADFGLAQLNGAVLVGAKLEGTVRNADLSAVHIEETDLRDVFFKDCTMSGTVFGSMLRDTTFDGGTLSSANFASTALLGVIFQNISLTNARFEEAHLHGVKFRNVDLRGANFWGATFDQDTQLPDDSYWTPETDITVFGAILKEPEKRTPPTNSFPAIDASKPTEGASLADKSIRLHSTVPSEPPHHKPGTQKTSLIVSAKGDKKEITISDKE